MEPKLNLESESGRPGKAEFFEIFEERLSSMTITITDLNDRNLNEGDLRAIQVSIRGHPCSAVSRLLLYNDSDHRMRLFN